MSTRTVEYAVGRTPEMSSSGRGVSYAPLHPVDLAEPELGSEHMLINLGPQHPATRDDRRDRRPRRRRRRRTRASLAITAPNGDVGRARRRERARGAQQTPS